MDKCSIPVIATCSGVEIGPRMMGQSAKEEIPSITLSLSIGIPVKELLAALSSFQQPPAPDDVPDCFLPDFSRKGSCGNKAEAVVRLPEQTSKPIRGGQGGQASSPPSLSSKWEAVPRQVGPRVLLGGPDWSGFPPSLTRVKVSNILKRVRPDELRQVFEEHAGPVLDISVVEDSAILIFDSHENAKKAVDEYDGCETFMSALIPIHVVSIVFCLVLRLFRLSVQELHNWEVYQGLPRYKSRSVLRSFHHLQERRLAWPLQDVHVSPRPFGSQNNRLFVRMVAELSV